MKRPLHNKNNSLQTPYFASFHSKKSYLQGANDYFLNENLLKHSIHTKPFWLCSGLLKKILFIIVFVLQSALFSLEVIGNFSLIELEQFKTSNIKAKLDTGAFFCALHCNYIKQLDDENVEFTPLDLNQKFTKKIQKIVSIKSSNGQIEKRFIIETTIKINGKLYPISFSLTNRQSMDYKILLGTEFIKNKFLIDVSK